MTTQEQKDFLVNHIVDRLTEYLVTDNTLELADALKIVYQSKTYQRLQDMDGSLYIQSPSYVYELLQKELKGQLVHIIHPDAIEISNVMSISRLRSKKEYKVESGDVLSEVHPLTVYSYYDHIEVNIILE